MMYIILIQYDERHPERQGPLPASVRGRRRSVITQTLWWLMWPADPSLAEGDLIPAPTAERRSTGLSVNAQPGWPDSRAPVEGEACAGVVSRLPSCATLSCRSFSRLDAGRPVLARWRFGELEAPI